jgi:Na+/H+-dicarboxylate symporter
MLSTAEQTKNTKKVGYLRLAMVSATTAVLIALGLTAAYFNMPTAGQVCSVRNATTNDSAGRTMWCNPTSTESRDLVWQYRPAA